MQIDIEFEEGQSDFIAPQAARLFCDIQRLMIFAMALAHDDLRSDLDLFGSELTSYDSLLFVDQAKATSYPPEHIVLVKSLRLNSPLKITIGVYFRGMGKALEAIVKMFEAIITADHIRRSKELDNLAKEQIIIRERLQTYEQALRLAERIEDPERRAAFEQNLELTLRPFLDGSYLPVRRFRPSSGISRPLR